MLASTLKISRLITNKLEVMGITDMGILAFSHQFRATSSHLTAGLLVMSFFDLSSKAQHLITEMERKWISEIKLQRCSRAHKIWTGGQVSSYAMRKLQVKALKCGWDAKFFKPQQKERMLKWRDFSKKHYNLHIYELEMNSETESIIRSNKTLHVSLRPLGKT